MNIKLPKNEKLLILSTAILLIGLFAGIFFFVLYPKMQQVPIKETELKSQEQLLSALQSKITNTDSNTFQSTVSLQKLVPVKPLTEQLLLDIEKAEVVSGSFVVSMSFEDSEMTAEEQQEAEEVETVEEQVDEQLNPDETTEEEETKEPIPLPTGVNKITVTLNVESPSYFELEKFIGILESSERIIVIDSIDFTAGEEIIDVEQTDKPLSYQVILSAFYMPTLSDLIESLPKMERPEPANKKNPLSKFGEVTEGASKTTGESVNTSQNSSDQTKNNASDESSKNDSESTNDKNTSSNTDVGSQEYTVKQGDNLTKISKQFFPDDHKAGILKIKEANNMKNDVIRVGQILIIPGS